MLHLQQISSKISPSGCKPLRPIHHLPLPGCLPSSDRLGGYRTNRESRGFRDREDPERLHRQVLPAHERGKLAGVTRQAAASPPSNTAAVA